MVRPWLLVVLLLGSLTRPSSSEVVGSIREPSVVSKRLEEHVVMLSDTLAPRDYTHPDNLNRAADYVKEQFAAAGGSVSEQTYFSEVVFSSTTIRRRPYRNIIASFGPPSGERILVGAHYDVAGPNPGADDNASAVAVLIELARLLGQRPPATRTDLIAFTLEEPPYFATPMMGSAIHAASLKRDGVRVRAMICMDMVGYYSDKPHSQQSPAFWLRPFYPNVGNYLMIVGRLGGGRLARTVRIAMQRASSLRVYSIKAPAFVTGVDWSDHRNYWAQGYPAVLLTDTSFYRNPYYHSPEDLADRLDYRRMEQLVQGLTAAIEKLSSSYSGGGR